MSVVLNPYLSFAGTAREAMEFYQSVFGGELTVSTFEDLHAEVKPEEMQLVMHSQLTSPIGLVLMGSDQVSHIEPNPGTDISVSLSGDDEAALTSYWEGLTEGANVTDPLAKAPWGDSFGMLVDKFGIAWLINITAVAA